MTSWGKFPAVATEERPPDGNEDSQDDRRRRKPSFNVMSSWGKLPAATTEEAAFSAAFSISQDDPQTTVPEKTSLSEAVRLAALIRRLQKMQSIDRLMLGCMVPSLALMMTSEEMERNLTRLIIEAVNSAITFVLLCLLVRYHRLHKSMSLSAMGSSDQVKSKRFWIKVPCARGVWGGKAGGMYDRL